MLPTLRFSFVESKGFKGVGRDGRHRLSEAFFIFQGDSKMSADAG